MNNSPTISRTSALITRSSGLRRPLIMLSLMLMCLSACETTTTTSRSAPAVIERSSDRDLMAEARGQSGAQAQLTYLQAAERAVDAGDFQRVAAAHAQLDPQVLPSSQFDRYARIELLLALSNEDFEAVEFWLPQARLQPGEAAEARARVCTLHGFHACAAEQWMLASEWASDPTALNPVIWAAIGAARQSEQAHLGGTTTDRALGWWSLANIVANANPIAQQQREFAEWQRRFPSHPARMALPAELTYLTEPWQPPRVIAALLPLSGNLAGAGSAVRDGLIAGQLQADPANRATLRFYDTVGTPIGELYERVLTAGADAIVGPLLKAQAAELARIAVGGEQPIIVLNRIDTPGSPAVYQFAVAIEDEAADITHRIARDGHQRVLAIVADGEAWADRAYSVLSQHTFEVLETASVTDATQMTDAIGQAMRVKDSETRAARMRQLLGEEVEFTPRGRKDLDAVVAFVDNVQSEALAPALRYHFADELPVYTGAQAIRGVRRLRALNGFHVTDLPLAIAPNGNNLELVDAFSLTPSSTAALYALGADAYQITHRLPSLRSAASRYPGATGELSIDAQNVVVRRQAWGQVVDGQLVAAP